ncbi:MAG: dihydrofolate reductase [Pirellulaceae bacterium]|nr:dihydrofolate reductase [Pirellulaceae bacterium]
MNATIIVAAAENGTIGRDNQLPWRLRSDLQRFKQLTMGHALVMGRKTFESIGRVLPGRTTIVLSRSKTFSHPGVQVVSSFEEALQCLPKDIHPFIVGGSEVYRQSLAWVDRISLTRVLADIPGDAKLDAWDRNDWRLFEQQHIPQGPNDEFPTIFETWHRATATECHSSEPNSK